MVDIMSGFRMTIGGVAVSDTESMPIVNPATGHPWAAAPRATRDDLDAAVGAAREALRGWKKTSIDDRRAVILKIADMLETHADALARLLTLEQGRPLDGARGELMASAYWCRSVAQFDLPVTVVEDSPDRLTETRHVPLGVVGAIVPWNFPVLLGIWKIAPALLAGNTLVVKPSPFTPLVMLKIGELMAEHAPPGVLNVISGGDELGPWLTSHPGVDKISFTGSTETGRKVMQSAASSLKRLTLELGGNDPAIILPDVDIDDVVPKLFWGAFHNSGQICIAAKRIYVHDAVYDAFAAAFCAYARNVKLGDGLEQGVGLGPVQNRAQYDRLRALIDDARHSGSRFLMGGEALDGEVGGFFIPITVIDNPPDDSRIVSEEAFGPVVPLLRFKETTAAIQRANATEYGLAASVWTRDLSEATRIASELEAGTVWINEIQHLSPWATFGGHKQSGLGSENGLAGLLQYTSPQTVSVRRS